MMRNLRKSAMELGETRQLVIPCQRCGESRVIRAKQGCHSNTLPMQRRPRPVSWRIWPNTCLQISNNLINRNRVGETNRVVHAAGAEGSHRVESDVCRVPAAVVPHCSSRRFRVHQKKNFIVRGTPTPYCWRIEIELVTCYLCSNWTKMYVLPSQGQDRPLTVKDIAETLPSNRVPIRNKLRQRRCVPRVLPDVIYIRSLILSKSFLE